MKKGDKLACTGGIPSVPEGTVAVVSRVGRKYTYVRIPHRHKEYRLVARGEGVYTTEEGRYYLYTQEALKREVLRMTGLQIAGLFRNSSPSSVEGLLKEIQVLIRHAEELPAVAGILQRQTRQLAVWDVSFKGEDL